MDFGDNGIIQFDTDACFFRTVKENSGITDKILGDENSFWRYFSNHDDVISFEGEQYFFIIIEQHVKQYFFKVHKVYIKKRVLQNITWLVKGIRAGREIERNFISMCQRIHQFVGG